MAGRQPYAVSPREHRMSYRFRMCATVLVITSASLVLLAAPPQGPVTATAPLIRD